MITTSEIKISCIIKIEESQKAVKAIHDQFNLAYSKEEIIV
jgi:aspartokinase